MENKQFQRQTAYKASIRQLLEGPYKKNNDTPDVVVVGATEVARANIIGVIVSAQKDETGYTNIMVDDGTSSMLLRSFEELPNVQVGDLSLIIGRLREFNDRRYMIPEIIRKLDDPKWVELRKKELEKMDYGAVAKTEEAPAETQPKHPELDVEEETVIVPESPAEKLLEKIRDIDKGEGADFVDIGANFPDAEKLIQRLLSNGDIFEIRPGRYKVLE